MSEEKDWRAAVLEVLPEKSKELLGRLEEYAGREIGFAAYTTPPEDGEVNPDAPATEMTAAGARILVRDGMPIPAQGITHELLHIERYWLEGVPQLFPANPANAKNCAQMENALEHLAIVPREAAYGFEPYGHWNDTYGKRWTGNRLAPTKPSAVLRMEALMGWLATSTVTDEGVKATMAKIIQDAGFFSEAEKFKARMNQFVSSKEQMAKCLARFLKIPDGAVVLRYFNAKAQTVRDEKLTAY